MAENYGNIEAIISGSSRVVMHGIRKPIPQGFAHFLLNDSGKDVMNAVSAKGIVVKGSVTLNARYTTEHTLLAKYFDVAKSQREDAAKSHREYEDARSWIKDNCLNDEVIVEIDISRVHTSSNFVPSSRVLVYAMPQSIPQKFAHFLLNDSDKDVMNAESANGMVVKGSVYLDSKYTAECTILAEYFNVAKSQREYEAAWRWVDDNHHDEILHKNWIVAEIDISKEYDSSDFVSEDMNVTYAGSFGVAEPFRFTQHP